MDIKQQYGTRFQGVGTATLGTAVVTQGLAGGAAIYVTDAGGSSDVGTAVLEIRDDGAAIWQNTISATVPYSFSFTQPLKATGTVTVYINGDSLSLKTVNVAGYII